MRWGKVEAAFHYFHRQRTSSPSQLGDVVLIPSTNSFQGMPGYIQATMMKEVLCWLARIGLAARGIPKARARSPSLLCHGRWRRLKPRAGDFTPRAGGGAVSACPWGARPRYSGRILYRLGRPLDVALEWISWAACAQNGVRNSDVPVSSMVCVQSECL